MRKIMIIATLAALCVISACAAVPQEVVSPDSISAAEPQEEVVAQPTEQAAEPLDPTLFISEAAAEGAVEFVERYLLALKNNDVEAYKSCWWRNEGIFLPADGTLAVISLDIESVVVDWPETARYRDMYTGSELAGHHDWSDEYLLHNFIVVHALYTVDYDNTKVSNFEGRLSHYLFLTREDEGSPWRIWDNITPWEITTDDDEAVYL